jgi:hypothetical protein
MVMIEILFLACMKNLAVFPEFPHSNIADQKEGSPISIENLIVHVLAKGNCYNLNKRKFPAEVLQEKNS